MLWHRWFGLFAALWLFLMAATGSFVVFLHEIDRALNPDIRLVEPTGQYMPVQSMVDALETRFAGKRVDFFVMPESPTESATAFIASERKSDDPPLVDADFLQTYVDPYTSNVLGSRQFGEPGVDRRRLAQFIYQLHMDLLMGPWMAWFLGLIALLWIIDHVVSAALSFPGARKWTQSFSIRWKKGSHRRTFDLHRAIGLWLLPVTLTLAITGLAFNWPDEWRSTISLVSSPTAGPLEKIPNLPERVYQQAVSVDTAIALAEKRVGSKVQAISWHPDLGVWNIRMANLDDTIGPEASAIVGYDGEVRSVTAISDASTGDVINAWVFPLHSGQAFGWWGRIAIFMAGIATCMFVVTGVMMWNRKRKARMTGIRKRRHSYATSPPRRIISP